MAKTFNISSQNIAFWVKMKYVKDSDHNLPKKALKFYFWHFLPFFFNDGKLLFSCFPINIHILLFLGFKHVKSPKLYFKFYQKSETVTFVSSRAYRIHLRNQKNLMCWFSTKLADQNCFEQMDEWTWII